MHNKLKRKFYGQNWKEMNKWFKKHKHLFKCENCLENQANVIHHIINVPMKFHDNPHYWRILCNSCHFYTKSMPQHWEISRLEEWSKLTNVSIDLGLYANGSRQLYKPDFVREALEDDFVKEAWGNL